MKIENVEIPKPRPTDVLIRVKACGVVPNLTNVLKHWRDWFPELPLPTSLLLNRSPFAEPS
jgi:alcohol dehydrogenase